MKKSKPLYRALSLLLALVLLISLAAPAMAETAGGENKVAWEKIDNEDAGVSLPLLDAEESESASVQYSDSDSVRVSIVLDEMSTLEAGYSTCKIADNASAMSYRSTLKSEQNAVASAISAEALGGKQLDVVWNLTLTANIISANVLYGQLDDIEAVDGVKEVIIETQYSPCVSSVGGDDPAMATSGTMIGSYSAWAEGYTGAGARIAIVDTGLDTDHQSFAGSGYEYSLQQNAEALGVSYEEYAASLNLMTNAEVADKWSELNFSSRYGGDCGNTYFSSKVPFGANYVDNGIDITHDNDSQGEHGSHVAGIAAANSYIPEGDGCTPALQSVCTQGVAPDAQLIVMKVFGKGGGAFDSDYMAAIEDAIILGADAINLSLGSSNAGPSRSSTYQDILDSLADSDTVVVMSAGNSYSWAENTESGYLYSDGVNFSTAGSPGSYTNTLDVASVNNDGATGNFISVDESMLFYAETNGPNAKLVTVAGEHEFVFIDDVGTAEQFSALADMISGKVAICTRGTTSFSTKMDAAAAVGAVALLVVNNQAGSISMDLSKASSSIPCVSLAQSSGEIFKAAAEYNAERDCYTGSLTVSSSISSVSYGSDYYTMSGFSSWGVPGSLELKPEITAPGGNIYSVNGAVAGGRDYEVMSGTSMAAPQITGMSALVAQYIRESGLDSETGLSPRQLTQSLLMSTATPVIEEVSGGYYSVLKQGAGLANVSSAIGAESYIMMNADATKSFADGKIKAELGDDPERGGEYSFSFELNNLTDEAKSFMLSADFFTQAQFTKDAASYLGTETAPLSAAVSWTVDGKALDAEAAGDIARCDFNGDGEITNSDGQALLDYVIGNLDVISNDEYADLDDDGDVDSYDAYLFFSKFSAGVLILPADGSVTVCVSVTLMDMADFDDCGAYVEGYVFAQELSTAEGVMGDSHSIPVLAYYGGWDESSMFDVGSYLDYKYGLETRHPYMYAADKEASFEHNAFLMSIPGDTAAHYLGGNPYVDDEVYMPQRNAVSSENGSKLSKLTFTAIRNAAASRFSVYADGELLFEKEMGSVTAAYYNTHDEKWRNTGVSASVNYSIKGTDEGTVLDFALTLAPEYYLDSEGKVDWEALNDGASLKLSAVVDNTSPEIRDIALTHDLMSDSYSLDLTASDNQYIAAVALYSYEGELLGKLGSRTDAEPNSDCSYSFELEELSGKYLVQVYDYALNCTSYKVNADAEEAAGEITLTISDTELELVRGNDYRLSVEVTPWGTPDPSLSWSSDNEAVASVSSSGVISAVAAGSAVITATSNADPAKSVSCEVTVVTVPITISGVLQDKGGQPTLFTWNLDTEEEWTAAAEIDAKLNAFAYDWLRSCSDEEDPESESYKLGYIMNSNGYMFALNMSTYEIEDESESSTAYGDTMDYMDFAFHNNETKDADMIFGICKERLLYSADPISNTFNKGWNLSSYMDKHSGGSAFTAMAWGGVDSKDRDVFYILDNANYMWTVYYDGGTKVSLGYSKTDLELSWPKYNGRQLCSMVWGDDGNFYLSYFTGDTNEIYQLIYDEENDVFSSRLLGNMGDSVWPCALAAATLNAEELPPHPADTELPEALDLEVNTAAEGLKAVELESETSGAVTGELNSAGFIAEVSAETLYKTPVAGTASVPSVSDKEEFVYIDVTVSDAEGKALASTNGIVELDYNEECLELISIEPLTDYCSINGSRFGYVDLEGIAAGEAVAKLTFKVLSGADVGVTVKTVEAGSDKAGYTEKIDTSKLFKHENTVLKGYRAATCTTEGYTGDLYCADCGILLQQGKASPVIPHSYGEWVLVKAAGCKTEGLEKCVCTKCGDTATRVVAPAGHIADPYNDISSSGYHDGIISASELGIVSGFRDGTFRPAADVTRAQFVTMLWRVAGSPQVESRGFKDVAENSPYRSAIEWASSEGIAAGYTATEFRPNQTITRAQMATFMYRYLKNVAEFDFGAVPQTEKTFADCAGINPSYIEAINAMASAGIMSGVGSGVNFAPYMTANRGMAATVLVRIYDLINRE